VEERQATVVELLEARSGVYHGANYETPQIAAAAATARQPSARHLRECVGWRMVASLVQTILGAAGAN